MGVTVGFKGAHFPQKCHSEYGALLRSLPSFISWTAGDPWWKRHPSWPCNP